MPRCIRIQSHHLAMIRIFGGVPMQSSKIAKTIPEVAIGGRYVAKSFIDDGLATILYEDEGEQGDDSSFDTGLLAGSIFFPDKPGRSANSVTK